MAAKPNIIVFMTDHQRGDTIQAGSPVKTPNLDRFRKQAVNFTRAYCPAPHCCPSRATFFSGLYPTEHGVWNNVNVSNTLSRGLYEGTRLFSLDLKEAGYRLYFSGKWHVSAEEGPEDFGFETLYHPYTYQKSPRRPDTREWHWYDGKNEMDTGEEERTEGRILRPGYPPYIQYGIDESPFDDAEVAQAAADYLAQMEDATSPFFLYVGPLGPHDPYFVPQRFLDLYPIEDIRLPDNFADSMDDKPALYRRTQDRYSQLTPEEHRECIRRFYAFCSYEDYLFGKVLEQMEKRGIMENTLILYVSDHGDYMGSHGLWAKGLPCFQEAYRVCAMAGGGVVKSPGREETALLSLADWYPTFLELAGLKPHPEQHMDGVSIAPLLRGEPMPERPLFWHYPHYGNQGGEPVAAVRRGNYKLLKFFEDNHTELYDLSQDIGESFDLTAEKPALSKELEQLLEDWIAQVGGLVPEPNPNWPEA